MSHWKDGVITTEKAEASSGASENRELSDGALRTLQGAKQSSKWKCQELCEIPTWRRVWGRDGYNWRVEIPQAQSSVTLPYKTQSKERTREGD